MLYNSDQIRNVAEVAIAVHDATAAEESFKTLFGVSFDDSWEIEADSIRVRAADVGETQIHLLEPTAATGPVYSFLQDNGEGLHHFCLEVEDIDVMLAHFGEVGAEVVYDVPNRHEDAAYVFLHPAETHGVLVELIAFDN